MKTIVGRLAVTAAAVLASAAIFTIATAPKAAEAGGYQTGSLTVTPSSGPVGTVVQISGTGCNNPGQDAFLFFLGVSPSGPTGAADIDPTIPVDSEGRFSITFTVPSELGTYQGFGGGPVLPGQYRIESKPPYCSTDFTVTGAPSLPDTGGPHAPQQQPFLPYTTGLGLLLSIIGAATVAAAARRTWA